MDLGSGSFEVFAEIGIELSDSKAGYFFVLGLGVFFEEEYKLLALHVIESDVDILRLPPHDLVEKRTTLSRTHPPATLSTVFSCSSRV